MNRTTAQRLIELDNAFYRTVAPSFSATRTAPWQGWQHVASLARDLAAATGALSVLDLACGTMRLATFLAAQLGEVALSYHGVDACAELAALHPAAREPRPAAITFTHADVLSALLDEDGEVLSAEGTEHALQPVDLACCFGFMHHVPGRDLRLRVLRGLLDRTRPGGLVVVSFWQFMDDERLARKARRTAERALASPPWPDFSPDQLEPGDHLLDWQDSGALRYCHHATDDEISSLVAALSPVGGREVERFSADGASGALNRYLVLERC